MTNIEKALAGLEFVRGGKELKEQREYAEKLCFRFNSTPPQDTEKERKDALQVIRPSSRFRLVIMYGSVQV